ncbi:MAG: hypothetical protein IPL12_22740 [Bacteroidetes bacterium]|nr:hypothetical protein [Bacteroidota bacterium]
MYWQMTIKSLLMSIQMYNGEEVAQTASGDAVVLWNTDGSFNIQKLNIKVSVKSIKSDKGSIMDDKTYDALKGEKKIPLYHF